MTFIERLYDALKAAANGTTLIRKRVDRARIAFSYGTVGKEF